MKKYLLPIMALALTFSFVACGDDEDEVKPAEQQTVQPTPKQDYVYSFEKKSYGLVDKTEITLTLVGKDGKTLAVEEDTKVTLAVDAASTANAENYEFPAEITIPAAKYEVSFEVKAKNAEPQADANTFILVPTFPGDNFKAGQYPTTKVVLIGSFAKDLVGTWVMNELVTDKESMATSWGSADDYVNFPEFDAEDEMTIDATIVPAFKSGFKNFFIGEATYEDAGSYQLQGMNPIQLQVLKLTGVNRNFSASSKSEDNVAYIGVRNIEDGQGGNLLDVYLIDYVPTDFAANAVEWQCYAPYGDDPYCAWMSGCYINFTMKKKPVAAE